MTLCFYIAASLLVILIQTTIIPYHSLVHGFYDLPLLLVIYLALYRPIRESLPMVIGLGFVMDSLSGSPLGLYVSTYFWTCAGILWFMTFLHIRNRLLLPIVVAAAVLVENIIFLAGMVMLVPDMRMVGRIFSTVSVQVLWAAVTGPLFIIFIEVREGQHLP